VNSVFLLRTYIHEFGAMSVLDTCRLHDMIDPYIVFLS